MEKHHKLRRPAGSSIHGCNICGIEGHQAAHCPNGSGTNWAEKFGPAWTVDLDALRHKEPDYDALAARAEAPQAAAVPSSLTARHIRPCITPAIHMDAM